MTGLDAEGGHGFTPQKETHDHADHSTENLVTRPLPPLADGSAAAQVPGSEEVGTSHSGWGAVVDAPSVLGFIHQRSVHRGEAREMDARKRAETAAGIISVLEARTAAEVGPRSGLLGRRPTLGQREHSGGAARNQTRLSGLRP